MKLIYNKLNRGYMYEKQNDIYTLITYSFINSYAFDR